MRISDRSSDVCSSDLDDPQVRKGMARVLESWGCAVMTAGDYDAAATLVAAAPEGVDLIIADYRLPRVPNGAPAAGRLREIGSASGRERVCQYVSRSEGAVSITKKITVTNSEQ